MEIKIVNHIDFAGECVPMEKLPEEKKVQIRELLQERMMVPAGYKRKTT